MKGRLVKAGSSKDNVFREKLKKSVTDVLNSKTNYRVVAEESELLKGRILKSTSNDTLPTRIQRPPQRRILPSVLDATRSETEAAPVIDFQIFSDEH